MQTNKLKEFLRTVDYLVWHHPWSDRVTVILMIVTLLLMTYVVKNWMPAPTHAVLPF